MPKSLTSHIVTVVALLLTSCNFAILVHPHNVYNTPTSIQKPYNSFRTRIREVNNRRISQTPLDSSEVNYQPLEIVEGSEETDFQHQRQLSIPANSRQKTADIFSDANAFLVISEGTTLKDGEPEPSTEAQETSETLEDDTGISNLLSESPQPTTGNNLKTDIVESSNSFDIPESTEEETTPPSPIESQEDPNKNQSNVIVSILTGTNDEALANNGETRNSNDVLLTPMSSNSDNNDITKTSEVSDTLLSPIESTPNVNNDDFLEPTPVITEPMLINSNDDMDIGNEEAEELELIPTTTPIEDNTWVHIPIVVMSKSGAPISDEFNNAVRTIFANLTSTEAADWTLIDVIPGTSESGTPSAHGMVYQGEIEGSETNSVMNIIEEAITNKDFDRYLSAELPGSDFRVRFATTPYLVNEPEQGIDVVNGTTEQPPKSDSTSSEEVAGESLAGNSQTDSVKGRGKRSSSLGLILGLSIGMFVLAISAVALFAYLRRHKEQPPHLLDGEVVAPTTISSIATYETNGTNVPTGAPTHVRGTDQLQAQSRIMDWQMDHAEAVGTAAHILGRENNDLDRISVPD